MVTNFDFQSLLQNVSKISLPGGMVGKVCKVLIIAAISMAIIAWSVKIIWVSVLAIMLIFILCFVMLWKLISFADKNPQAALLEGAEFLVHEQIKLGTKANPQITLDPANQIEGRPIDLSPKEISEAQQPDIHDPQIEASGKTGGKEGHNG